MMVSEAWNEGINSSFHTRLESCANFFKEWAEGTFRETKRLIKLIEKKLAKAQKQSPNSHMLATCSKIPEELDSLHRVEEAYWHLRFRKNQLKDGDKNTKYFHRKASSRKKRNLIRGLTYKEGNWNTSKVDIERLVTAYFESIFATSSPSGFAEALEGIFPAVTLLDFWSQLTRIFALFFSKCTRQRL